MRIAARIDDVTFANGAPYVRLRPSLRAATLFVRAQGFTELPKRITELHLGTIRDLITATATDRQEASAFLAWIDATPLKIVAATITVPLLELVAGFVPAPDESARSGDQKAKPMPWPFVYRELFRTATGWLGWTPETAWNATPFEINEAFAGHVAKLKAIHGTADKDDGGDYDPRAEVEPAEVSEGIARLKAGALRGKAA